MSRVSRSVIRVIRSSGRSRRQVWMALWAPGTRSGLVVRSRNIMAALRLQESFQSTMGFLDNVVDDGAHVVRLLPDGDLAVRSGAVPQDLMNVTDFIAAA